MKILWIVNILFPEANQLLTGRGDFRASGGWMIGAAEALVRQDNIFLAIAAPTTKVKKLQRIHGKRIDYYLFPLEKSNRRCNSVYESYWKKIELDFNPDIVHIHGTEYSHGLAYVNMCGNKKVVVSIQGLISVITKYYDYGISKKDEILSITLRDVIRGSVFHEKTNFKKRGENEKELINKVNHVIGRTSWDKAQVWAINPSVTYHFCNETLRSEFYTGMWEYSKCKCHSIFVSQAGYPFKGFHQLLKAMPIVLLHYPDTIIKVAGGDLTNCSNIINRLRLSGYGKYIKHLIKHYKLEDHVVFLGSLDAEQMKREYLHANVFICPSSIENSPNSLCEAQLLGVPVLASYAGGIPTIMRENEDYLYRFEETEEMAYKICSIFKQGSRVNTKEMRIHALERHNAKSNLEDLLAIYKCLID